MIKKHLRLKLVAINIIVAISAIIVLQATINAKAASDNMANSMSVTSSDCLQCHSMASDFQNKFLHKPFAEKDCLACHENNPSDHYPLKEQGDKLCYLCHLEMEAKFKFSVHANIGTEEGNNCLKCHTSRSSKYPNLLAEEPVKQCLDCHPQEDEFSYHPVGGDIIDDNTAGQLTCTSSCHAPHGEGVAEDPTLRKTNDGLCLDCHPM